MYQQFIEGLKADMKAAQLFPLKNQAELSTKILKERLETVLPWAMEQSKIDFWLVMSRENCEDPIIRTLFTWDMPEARRVSILAFHRDCSTGVIRKMSVGMQSPEMASIYENVQSKDETVWQALARIIKEIKPVKIGVDRSAIYGFCDGLSSTLLECLKDAVGEEYALRICDAEELTVRWLQRVCPTEKSTMESLVNVTHKIVNFTFSKEFIRPNKTTTTDVEWAMRDIISEIGYNYWFGPDVDLQREGNPTTRMFNEVIQPGDLLHCDIGINGLYLHLHTDMQWVAYILKNGETEAPNELEGLLATGNDFRDIVRGEMQENRTGNEVFEAAIKKAREKGITPMLYTHPLGTFGHGAGPTVGLYTNQGFVKGTGERCIEDKTCYALELNVCKNLELWKGQNVFMYLEEDICKDGTVEFLDGYQKHLMLI